MHKYKKYNIMCTNIKNVIICEQIVGDASPPGLTRTEQAQT